jgi:hypothetical protein
MSRQRKDVSLDSQSGAARCTAGDPLACRASLAVPRWPAPSGRVDECRPDLLRYGVMSGLSIPADVRDNAVDGQDSCDRQKGIKDERNGLAVPNGGFVGATEVGDRVEAEEQKQKEFHNAGEQMARQPKAPCGSSRPAPTISEEPISSSRNRGWWKRGLRPPAG